MIRRRLGIFYHQSRSLNGWGCMGRDRWNWLISFSLYSQMWLVKRIYLNDVGTMSAFKLKEKSNLEDFINTNGHRSIIGHSSFEGIWWLFLSCCFLLLFGSLWMGCCIVFFYSKPNQNRLELIKHLIGVSRAYRCEKINVWHRQRKLISKLAGCLSLCRVTFQKSISQKLRCFSISDVWFAFSIRQQT